MHTNDLDRLRFRDRLAFRLFLVEEWWHCHVWNRIRHRQVDDSENWAETERKLLARVAKRVSDTETGREQI